MKSSNDEPMALTMIERAVLRDICTGSNPRMHSRQIYQQLQIRSLVFKTLSGHWSATDEGNRVNLALLPCDAKTMQITAVAT